MTAVIKSSDPGRTRQVRALAFQPRPAAPSAGALRITELETALYAARARVEDLTASITALAADHARALQTARSEGLEDGRKAAEDRSDALAESLRKALERAVEGFHERLDRLEGSAVLLASTALERVVGDTSDRAEMVADAVKRAMTEVFGDDAVRLDVSDADFPDESALRHLSLPEGCEVRVTDTLESGGCIVTLKLGRVDLGLNGQVARLRAELARGAAT